MINDKKTSLRVLYTINSSPQYILARSHSLVQITLIQSLDAHNPQDSSDSLQPHQCLYANVLLKTCLNTICRSSPELTHDSTRDFSLYVLDPLESNSAPAPVQINNSNQQSSSSSKNTASAEQPRGVAVGLGLMSWALASDDNDGMTVVGTLVKQSNGQEALEVIFALRETMAMKRPAWSMPPPSCQYSSSQESTASSTTGIGSSQPESKPFLTNQLSASSSSQSHSSTANLTRETLASIQMRAKVKIKPTKPTRTSTVPVTESDKLMNAGTFIGPMKKKGRPKTANIDTKAAAGNGNAIASGSTSDTKEIIVIDGSDSDGTLPTPTNSSFQITVRKSSDVQDLTKKKIPGDQYPTTATFKTESLTVSASGPANNAAPVPIKTEPSGEPSLLDLLAYLSATSSAEPNAQNAAILAALCTIDSSANNHGNASSETSPNPALVSALKQLLSVCTQPSASVIPATPESSQQTRPIQPAQPSSEGHHGSHSSDDSVILMDKENVNPKVYQKRNDKDGKSVKVTESLPPVASSSGSHVERPLQSLSLSARSANGSNSSRTSLKDSVLAPGGDKVVRKRTLSDFMDEKEYCRSKGKGKGKERERVERRDGHRHVSGQRTPKVPVSDSLRHYPRLLASAQPRSEQPSNYYRTPLESLTSPGRPRPDHNDSSSEEQQKATQPKSQPPSKPPSPARGHRISASSPVRGAQQQYRRKYVVPEWARTSTSTQPRLSEEAQRALEDLEERKRLERAAARRRLPSMQAKTKKKVVPSSKSDGATQERRPIVASDTGHGPVTSSDRPLFAASNIAFPFITTRSSSPPPNPTVIPKTPKTPTRDRHLPRPTPGQENESLFTPIMRSGSLFGSARSQSLRTPLPSVLTSPLGNRKKAKLSPAGSLLTGKSPSKAWPKMAALNSSEDSKNLEESNNSATSLERELEDALDDLQCPPSSLPIASSDIDVDETYMQPSENVDADVNINDDAEIIPVKQHWQGLPPSSPPAPSSPMLLPDSATDDDDEMDDIPIATSDSETDTDMTPCASDSNSPAYLDEEFASTFANTDFSSFLPAIDAANPSSDQSTAAMDIFQQFTHLNSDPNIFPSLDDSKDQVDPDLHAIFQNGLEGIDFTEFWETFKPLVNDNTQGLYEQPTGEQGNYYEANKDDVLTSFGDIDHVKLADDMQALLSGCLM